MRLLLQDLADLLARRLPDGADRAALMAEHELLLAVALHIDHLLDTNRAVLHLFPLFRRHMRRIGKLLMEPQIKLLARDLGGQLAYRQIRNLILRIVPRPLRQSGCEIFEQIAAAGPIERGNHESAVEGNRLIGLGGERKQALALDLVDLVQDQDLGLLDLREAFQDCSSVTLDATLGIDQEGDDVSVPGSAPGAADHGAVKPPTRLED